MRTRPKAQTPILDALPPYLRLDEVPDDEHVYRRWSRARSYWCRDNGYSVLELLRSERPRPAPGKRKPRLTDQETP